MRIAPWNREYYFIDPGDIECQEAWGVVCENDLIQQPFPVRRDCHDGIAFVGIAVRIRAHHKCHLAVCAFESEHRLTRDIVRNQPAGRRTDHETARDIIAADFHGTATGFIYGTFLGLRRDKCIDHICLCTKLRNAGSKQRNDS